MIVGQIANWTYLKKGQHNKQRTSEATAAVIAEVDESTVKCLGILKATGVFGSGANLLSEHQADRLGLFRR